MQGRAAWAKTSETSPSPVFPVVALLPRDEESEAAGLDETGLGVWQS